MTAVLPPWVIQASSHPADVFRRQTRLLALGNQGIKTPTDLNVTQNGTPNMSVNVAAGEAIINGTQNTTSQGAYTVLNDATVNLTIAAADPTNPRIDIVVAQVRDAAYSGASNDWILAVVTGTPAPSPSAPATPANSLVLAQVAVAANATSIVSGNITDKRIRFGTQFKARGYRNAAFNISSGNTWTKIPIDTVSWDLNGNLDVVTNNQYTAPIAGFYQVNANLVGSSFGDGAAINVGISINGTSPPQVQGAGSQAAAAASFPGTALADVLKLNANDTVQLFGLANPAGSIFIASPAGSSNYISIYFLSS